MGVGDKVATVPEGKARPELKALVHEASTALARLDAARLDELAVSCEALAMTQVGACEAREAMDGMAVLSRVLEATRANAEVMERLRTLRAEHIEYSERQARGRAAENLYGHD